MSAAGVDPAYIPGLMPARPAEGGEEGADAPPDDTVAEAEAAATGGAETARSGAGEAEAIEAPAGERASGERGDSDERGASDEDGPEFKVSDRRGEIVADRSGITFRLDAEEAEFAWDEIKAVEIGTPRFGKRFSVTVYTSRQRWFQTDVEASSRALLKQWENDLDAVLNLRFDDADA
ncbi:hypothetical protein ACWF94_12605 [Streptomyces sp. NPDC055078]